MKTIILTLLFALNVNAKVKIAVFDTGFNFNFFNKVKLCEDGHRDFTGEGFADQNGHGTNIVGLIKQQIPDDADYCVLIYKVAKSGYAGPIPDSSYVLAYQSALAEKVNIINYSSAGNYNTKEERKIVKHLLNKGVKIVAAAGNNDEYGKVETLSESKCNVFPACYDNRIVTVGNGFNPAAPSLTSNKGPYVKAWEYGNNVKAFGVRGSGTSQAAAIHTGKLVKKMLEGK